MSLCMSQCGEKSTREPSKYLTKYLETSFQKSFQNIYCINRNVLPVITSRFLLNLVYLAKEAKDHSYPFLCGWVARLHSSAVLRDLWRGDGKASGHVPEWRSV